MGEAATPKGAPGAPRRPRPLTVQDLSAAFTGQIAPVKVGLPYRVGLFVVAVVMVLLVVAYVAIIVLAGLGLFFHATQNVGILEGGRGIKGRLLVYLGPLVIGSVVLLFMVKPLFARPARPRPRLSLSPHEEPLLHALVSRISAAVGAPLPQRIDVDCEVNASASFARGLSSFYGGDLVLTVGLPLVAGLDTRLLAGVLAHELGHFAQGAGMRLTYLIRSVNAWFARVVYERDAWDQKLVEWAEEGDSRVVIVLQVSRVMVWLTRRVLWALMLCGHAVSCFMLRQMEFDADRYEARVAGSDAFGPTSIRLRLLAVSVNAAFSSLRQSWRTGQLGDDFPGLVVGYLSRMPENVRQNVEAGSTEARTRLFDTHPSDADRMRSVLSEKAPGVFRLEKPATSLVRDFAGLSRKATLLMYKEMIGDEVTAQNLVPSSGLLRDDDEIEKDYHALQTYFLGCLDPMDLPTLEADLQPIEEPAGAVEEIRKLRAKLEAAAPRARGLIEQLVDLRSQEASLLAMRSLRTAGVRAPAGAVPPAVDARLTDTVKKIEEVRRKLAPMSAALCRRWALALRVLRGSAGAAIREASGAGDGQLPLLLGAQAALDAAKAILLDLERTCIANRALAGAVGETSEERERKRIVTEIQKGVEDWRRQLGSLDGTLRAIEHPFAPAGRGGSIAEHAIGQLPATALDVDSFFRVAFQARDDLRALGARIRGRLALLAGRVEADVAGLPPLSEPPPAEGEAPSHQ